MKHTPPPWDSWGAAVFTDAHGYLCAVSFGENEKQAAEAHANARLIAAAPMLLDALRDLLKVAPASAPAAGVIKGIEDQHAAALAAARLAIERAT